MYEHDLVSDSLPLHGKPLLKGPSQFRERELFAFPLALPHDAEQADHGLQFLHFPSTVRCLLLIFCRTVLHVNVTLLPGQACGLH